jgi:hypothetical protein
VTATSEKIAAAEARGRDLEVEYRATIAASGDPSTLAQR